MGQRYGEVEETKDYSRASLRRGKKFLTVLHWWEAQVISLRQAIKYAYSNNNNDRKNKQQDESKVTEADPA